MKRYTLYNIRKAVAMLTLAALSVGFCACGDDDVVDRTAIDSPSASVDKSTVSSLTFTWDKVSNATQYAYELKDMSAQLIEGGITSANTVSFTGLTPNTTYTLDVWAYAATYSDTYKGSKVATFTATTPDRVKLATPQPTVTIDKSTAKVSWDRIDNAASYKVQYGLVGSDLRTVNSGRNSTELRNLAIGEYQLIVTAISGDEAFIDSDADTITFTRSKYALWQVEGKMQSGAKSWKAEIAAYDDNSYAILNWYGVEGYNFDFTVDSNNEIVVSVEYQNGWAGVQSGLTEDTDMWIYTSGGFSSFTGDKNKGNLTFWNSTSNGYDTFTWPYVAVTEVWRKTGTYHSELLNSTWSADLVSYSDGSYVLEKWYGVDGYNLNFTVQEDGLLVPSNSFWSGYGYEFVYTGLSDNYYMAIYPSSGYSVFSGNATDGGYISFYYAYSVDYVYRNEWFEWTGGTTETTKISIDDLAGSYSEHAVGLEYLWYKATFDWDGGNVSISVEDASTNTIKINNFFYSQQDITATVDLTNKTVTIKPQTFMSWYTLASGSGVDADIVGTFDENFTITFPNWAMWYNGYMYVSNADYNSGAASTLTKK